MQSAAGNHAVASLVTQRLDAGPVQSGCVAPPVEPTPADPQKDPQWAHAKHEIETKADATKAHPPASKEVGEAQNAAVAPPDDKEAQAKAAHTGKMDAAKPGGFDKAGFIAAVKAAIAAKAPKNLDEADKFAQSGKADQVKNEVMSKVTGGKQASAREIKDSTEATPDTSTAKDKPVTPLQPPPSPSAPPPPDPKLLAPKPAPDDQTRLGADSCATDHKMAEAGVTKEQLAKSNEPEFTGALEAKKTAEEHDANAPAAVREKEAQVIAGATADADATAKTGLSSITASKGSALQAAGAGKQATKSADEGERSRITGEIKKIFDKTKADVEGILTGLDKTVSERFEEGERKAKEAFVADHQARMAAYKAKRYGGPGGSALWLKDLLLDMPPEANALFLESKKLYESRMEDVIGGIADLVGSELARAKARVSEGRAQVQKLVAEQPKNLQKLAGDAAKEIGSQFEDLEKSVDEKQESLVDDLADKYIEARNAVDEEIKKLQAENKGFAGQAAEAIGGAIDTVKKLKDMLLGVFTRAANAVEKIIKDPMDFLGKFVNAVKTGIQNFMSNILTHLKKGLQGWLFGTLAEAGIEIPEKFDLKGIIGLLLSLLGLTWTSIRTRIVNVVGEKAMSAIEKGVDFVKMILTEGVPGLWKFIAQKISDLKEQVMSRIRDFVITKVIMAGVTWLISLLNPAAAFIKACKMIYDAVMWFVDNAQRLKDFVDSVLDSVESIAAGGVGKVAALIEGTLSKTVPMLISGLASLLGLGGIADKIKSILEKVQTPVGKAVDWLIAKAVKYGKKFLDRLKKSKFGKAAASVKAKAKAAYAKGKAWAKKKYEAGKAWVKKKYEAGKTWAKRTYRKARRRIKSATQSIGDRIREKCKNLLGIKFHSEFQTKSNGNTHTLYTQSGAPKNLYVASSPKPISHAFKHLDATKRSDLRTLEKQFQNEMDNYIQIINEIFKDSEVNRLKLDKATRKQFDKAKSSAARAEKVQKDIRAFARENMKDPLEGPGAHAPGIGTIAPYGAKISSLRGKNPVLEWKMEAEHIIPDAFIRRAMMGLKKSGEVTQEDTGYKLQPTILIYAGAAKTKTFGSTLDGRGDLKLIRSIRNIMGMIRDKIGGSGKRFRKVKSSKKVKFKGDWRAVLKDQFNRRIEPQITRIEKTWLERTMRYVKAEQEAIGDRRGKDATPRPSDSELQSCFDSQKQVIGQAIGKLVAEADFK
ncbi:MULTISPECIES: phage tail protein [Rhodococcus]|uniref:phage tail protein n=1 Tax=Rhodococcus TaxID=1827 RepID=UPI00203E0EAD|nr:MULTISPECIES: hypothetical protein [Rhodococcus]USC14251.1 hypothetical protein KZJ41_21765 [Rhodococcus sp. 11-3]WFS15682.1 hypothetical protein P9K37_11810 [Rhodococcus aetherivorans]